MVVVLERRMVWKRGDDVLKPVDKVVFRRFHMKSIARFVFERRAKRNGALFFGIRAW